MEDFKSFTRTHQNLLHEVRPKVQVTRPLYAGATTGLYPATLFDGIPLFKEGLEPSKEERATYLEQIWTPYHRTLQEELARLKAEFGYALLFDYFEWARGQGFDPPVIDTSSFLADPAAKLSVLCERLGIAWDPAMLSWERGIHAVDGIWARHWYDKVAASSGFGPPPGRLPELEGEAIDLALEIKNLD